MGPEPQTAALRVEPPTLSLCRRLTQAPLRLRQRLFLTAARFLEIGGPAWLGYARRRDYVVGRLQLPWSTYQGYAAAGRVLARIPLARALHAQGTLRGSALECLARHRSPEQIARLLPDAATLPVHELRELLSKPTPGCEPPTSEVDPAHATVSFTVPAPVALYAEETLELASALLGRALPPEQAVEAVVAEASSEIEVTVSGPDAFARFWRRRPRSRSAPPPAPCLPPPPPGEPPLSPSARRVLAHRLDRQLRRCLALLGRVETRRDDALLRCLEEGLHHRQGHRRFDEFARQHFDLSARDCWERIRRARRRRANDPLALALASGRLGPVKVQLLGRLAPVLPASAWPSWIAAAERGTCRHLQRMLAWARRETLTDLRSWTLAGCPPPTDEQLRTSDPSPQALADRPEPPEPEELLDAPLVALRWTLPVPTLTALLQLMATVQDRARPPDGSRPPSWWALGSLFVHARRAWAPQVRIGRPLQRRILDRDRYRCCAPDCSSRRHLEVHHLRPRSQGGGDEPENLVTLCAFHHRRGVHEGLLRVRGRARGGPDGLLWELGLDAAGHPLQRLRGEETLASSQS